MRLRHKLVIEIILALIISFWMYSDLDIHIIHIPFLSVYDLSFLYIFFSAFVIVAFSNAVNITDGLDGLASGVLMIALTCFWVVARAIIDVPTSLFIAVWLGGLVAFLYFNIYPARIFLGDTGALSFGATFAVIGLILGKPFSLPIIGGVFFLEVMSSFIQLLSKKFLKRKILPVAPLHLFFQMRKWEEPKVVMRLWIIGILFAFFGLMISFMK
jgi:phospho-N-acetylmuramoyl-pentapeptide-transferase